MRRVQSIFFTVQEAKQYVYPKKHSAGSEMDPKKWAKTMLSDRPSLETKLKQNVSSIHRVFVQNRDSVPALAIQLLSIPSFLPVQKLIQQLPQGKQIWQALVQTAVSKGVVTGAAFIAFLLDIYDRIQRELAKGTPFHRLLTTIQIGGSAVTDGNGDDHYRDGGREVMDNMEMKKEAQQRGYHLIPLTVSWIRKHPKQWRGLEIMDGQVWPEGTDTEPYRAEILGIQFSKNDGWKLHIKVDHESQPGSYDDANFEEFSEGEYSTQNRGGLRKGFNRKNIIVTGSGADPVYRVVRTEKLYLQTDPKKDEDLYHDAWMRLYNRLLNMDTERLDIGGDDSHADFAQFLLGTGTRLRDLKSWKYIRNMVKLWKQKGFPEMKDAFYAGKMIKR